MLLAIMRHNAPILFIINWYNYLNFKNRLKQGGGICCWPRWGTMPLSLSGSCLCLWCATQLLASDNIEPLFRPTLGGAGITFCNKRPFNLFSTHSRQETMNKRLILLWNDCVSSKIFFTIFLIHQGCSPCTVEKQTARPKKSSNSLTFVKILD